MNRDNEIKEFCVDNLSECSDGSESDDEKDTTDWNQCSLSEVVYKDSDSEDDNGEEEEEKEEEEKEEEEEDSVWSTKDEPITLEPFEGSPGIKITPNSQNVADVVNLFMGADLFEHMANESNRYHYQILNTYKIPSKTKKWRDITVAEMKKFLGLIVLMGQVKKDMVHEYWSTDPAIETPFFSKVMSRNRFMQILQTWHFSNNDNIAVNSNRLVKIQPVVDYLKMRFNEVYKPGQQLSLDEYVIPWSSRSISFRTCNSKTTMKDGLLFRALCESATGYICNFEIRPTREEKLEDTVLTVTEPYRNMWHHVYQDNYYNSVNLTRTLLSNKTRTCGTIRKSGGFPRALQSVKLSSGEIAFRRNRDVLLLIWNNGARNMNVISTIHNAQLMKVESATNKKSQKSIKKPALILDYNKYMKGVDRVNHYLEFYSILRKTKKWTTRVVMFLINCALFNSFKLYTELNGRKKMFKKFLRDVAVAWITNCESKQRTDVTNTEQSDDSSITERTDLSNTRSCSVEENETTESPDAPITPEPARRTPKMDHPDRLTNLKKHKLIKIISNGKSKMPQRQCRVCASKKIRSRTCFICVFCSVPLHKGDCYQRYHTLKKY
ncbi:piggyBac transposable element-derived protein 4-like [Pseudomyrmex gracilis]|uniref:piggyBac transposable element-derived protein 4-like n=1 Tax=Pseudomyrmex gracilis TaxID=219809 RepID=UPI00099571C1|nr:piggyBac transposable element-derived protein 4-like [Pseudomyrmex gracilis]